MLKVLIVEDEFLVRVGLRSSIDWEANGFELLEDAVDGEEAMQTIQEHLPDVILLDIRIPKIDGLEVLRLIKERNIPSTVVVISCFDDFEPVREAMRLGAADYLRKLSLKPQDLLHILISIREKLLNSSRQPTDIPAPSQQLTAHFAELIAGSRNELPDGLELKEGKVFFIDVDDPKNRYLTVNNTSFLNIIRQTLRSYAAESCVLRTGESTFCALFSSNHAELAVAMKIKDQIMRTTGINISIGIGEPWDSPESLRRSLEYAKQISYDKFYLNEGIVRRYAEASSMRRIELRPAEVTNRLDEFVEARDFSGMTTYIDGIFTVIRQDCSAYPDNVKVMCIDIINHLTRQCSPEHFYEETKMHDFKTIMDIGTLEQLRNYMLRRVDEICTDARQKCGYSPIVTHAITYIQKNICENISLPKLAKEVNVSESYLSMLFKKEIGENCISYINGKKIELAKSMLKDQLLVYEVAERLGFEHSNYFGKVFKKYVGTTPEQYRGENKPFNEPKNTFY